MKKMMIAFSCLLFSLVSNAQQTDEFTHSGVFADVTAGLFTGDLGNDFGFGLKAGYRYHVYKGISWDIVSIGASTCAGWYMEDYNMRFLTGIHYDLPKKIINKSLYANFALGYCFSTYDTSCGGFGYEIGAGINFSRLISLGLVWEGSVWTEEFYTIPDYFRLKLKENFGTLGIQLGLNF